LNSGRVSAQQQLDSGFIRMFDGESLAGWSVMPAGAAEAWTVQDGMIVGDGDKGRSYLTYNNKEIADFELKFSYRFPGKGNSGVSIRARNEDSKATMPTLATWELVNKYWGLGTFIRPVGGNTPAFAVIDWSSTNMTNRR
jgi:hypothetical protein